VVAFEDHLLSGALGGEAQRFVRDELVRGEAVVELDDGDVLGPDPRFGIGQSRGRGRHVVPDDVAHVALEAARAVGGQRLPGDAHGRA
jgi:hypothetical protein